MVTAHPITAADLESMGSDTRFELYQGVLHERSPSSARSALVLSNTGYELRHYVQPRGLGIVVFGEGGFGLETAPDTVVAPDVAFIRRSRVPSPIPERGFFDLIPDLVIEVISTTDEPGDIRRKQAVYDRVAVPLVWWIDPSKRTAAVQKPGLPVVHLKDADTLDGEDIVPGFSLSLASLFDF